MADPGFWGGINQHDHTQAGTGGIIPYDRIAAKSLVQGNNSNSVAQVTLGSILIPASIFSLNTRIEYETLLSWLQSTGVNQNEPTITLVRDGSNQIQHVGNVLAFAHSLTVRLIRFRVAITLTANGVFDYYGDVSFLGIQSSAGVVPVFREEFGFTNRAGFDQGSDHTISIAAQNTVASANYVVTHLHSVAKVA